MLTCQIIPIPAFSDNYIWCLEFDQHLVIVDPGDAQPVLKLLAAKPNCRLDAILVTHHHRDHCGGIDQLLQHHAVPVYGPARESIPHCQNPCHGCDKISLFNQQLQIQVLDIPGHTQGHIAYFVNFNDSPGMLFCGDTLFTGGCGRLFEGTATELYTSLTKLAALPDDTLIYCGHEYTLKNLQFALHVEPDNVILQQRYQHTLALRAKDLPTVPTPLSLEKQTNPFLRAHLPTLRAAAERYSHRTLNQPVEVFRQLRLWKDQF